MRAADERGMAAWALPRPVELCPCDTAPFLGHLPCAMLSCTASKAMLHAARLLGCGRPLAQAAPRPGMLLSTSRAAAKIKVGAAGGQAAWEGSRAGRLPFTATHRALLHWRSQQLPWTAPERSSCTTASGGAAAGTDSHCHVHGAPSARAPSNPL